MDGVFRQSDECEESRFLPEFTLSLPEGVEMTDFPLEAGGCRMGGGALRRYPSPAVVDCGHAYQNDGYRSLNPSYEIPVKGKDVNSHSSVVAMLFLLVIALEPNTMADVYFVRNID